MKSVLCVAAVVLVAIFSLATVCAAADVAKSPGAAAKATEQAGKNAAAGPGEAATSTVTPASGAGSPAFNTLKITRLLHRLPAEQLTRGRRVLVEGEPLPKEYQAETSWLIMKDAGAGNTAPLYRCDINSGKGSALSRRSSHPDMTSQEMIGYIYTKPGFGLVELRLVIPKGTPREGYFVTDFTNCEGDAYREEEFLGYAYRTMPYDVVASVTPSTLVPGGTLEISWKTTNVPDGQKGRVNMFPDRILGVALSPAAVSGAFIDEEGKITGEPKTDPFARHVPLSGSFVWNSTRSLSGEYAQKLPPGKYQIQFALFPECFYSHARPCELADILFTASNVFTVADPTPPSNRVSAAHRCPYGEIESRWQRTADSFTWRFTVPPNTTATVYVPTAEAASVTESGQPAAKSPHIALLRTDRSCAVYQVPSGRYEFRAAL